MFELLRVAIAILGSAGAGLWDLKTTEIPDWICAVMIASGLVLFGIEGWTTADWSGMTMSMVVGGAFALFGLGMYLAGQWGGGDGELLAALGILLPFWPFAAKSIFPLPIALFVNVFFVGAAYTISYAAALAISKPKLRAVIGRAVKADSRIVTPLTVGAAAAVAVLWALTGAIWLVLLPIAIAGIPALYRTLKAVEAGFYVRIPTKKLKAGDMLGQDIPRLKLYKRHIRGLTAAELKKIRATRTSVIIREGVRFGPVFPLALAVTLAAGDLATFIILGI